MKFKDKKAIEIETLLNYLLWILLGVIIALAIKALFERLGIIS